MFTSLIQLVEYLMWSDIDYVNGNNQFASLIGPILIYAQPVMLFILTMTFIERKNMALPVNLVMILNAIYVLHMFHMYIKYVSNTSKTCTKVNDCGRLNWKWKYAFDDKLHGMMSLINIVNLCTNINLILTMIVTYILLGVSYLKYSANYG